MNNKLNINLVNIIRSYLTISKEQVNRNKKLINYNIEILPLTRFSYKEIFCDYCINCDEKIYYYPNMCSFKYKIVFNKKPICDDCMEIYYNKSEILYDIEKFGKN